MLTGIEMKRGHSSRKKKDRDVVQLIDPVFGISNKCQMMLKPLVTIYSMNFVGEEANLMI